MQLAKPQSLSPMPSTYGGTKTGASQTVGSGKQLNRAIYLWGARNMTLKDYLQKRQFKLVL